MCECLGGGTGGIEPIGMGDEDSSREERLQITNGEAITKWSLQRVVQMDTEAR